MQVRVYSGMFSSPAAAIRLLVQLDRNPPRFPVPPSLARSKYPAAPDRNVSRHSDAAGVLHP